MSGHIFQTIDSALASLGDIRSGQAAYAKIMTEYAQAAAKDPDEAWKEFIEAVVGLASALHRRSSGKGTELLTFSDGANECLFDATNERTVMMYGVSKTTAPNSRDNSYHGGYPRAGDGYDKGHALSHAQGGLEGGPNYFRQRRAVNQRRSLLGHLWRDIETHLAANAGVFAFVRLIYQKNDKGDRPFEVEYGILNGPSQYRIVVFPN